MNDMTAVNGSKPPDFLKTFDRLPGAVLISRATGTGDGEILYANKGLLDMFECRDIKDLKNFSRGSAIGLVYPDDVDSARWYIRKRSQRASSQRSSETGNNSSAEHMQCRIQTKSGRILEIADVAHYFTDPEEGRLVYSILYQIGQNAGDEEIDTLTGLPRMRTFLNYAEKMLKESRESGTVQAVYFLYLNLAHFKRYNIRHGLDEGDLFLQQISELLRDTFSDGYIARFDADHFAVLTVNPDYIRQIRTVHDQIAKLCEENTVELKAGVYEAAAGKMDIAVNAACDLAKIACDSLSSSPDDYIRMFDEQLAHEVNQRDYIVENINKAIQNGWIEVYYQPVVRSISGAVCGFEALTRWIDPQYGFMNPGVFIPVLEENHLIHKLDLYVIDQVCRKISDEIRSGRKPVPISFNLSRLDFMLCDCFAAVEASVAKYQIPRYMVRIEITESTVMRDKQIMADEIARFRHAGYQVWMDDFGSGYSSLNMLKDFYFDEIKLDMDFLRSFTPESREIVASTVRMAKKLGMHTLAEGVETEEQADFLRSIGCEKMQGYYFGKPQPFNDSMHHCLEVKELSLETRTWAAYYDQLGLVNLQTERPIIVLDCDDDGRITLLYNNRPCEDVARQMGYGSIRQILDILQKAPSASAKKAVRIMTDTDWENDEKKGRVIYLTGNGHLAKLELQYVVSAPQHRAFTIYVSDLSSQDEGRDIRQMDATLRNILTDYDNIYVVHFDGDYMDVKFQGPFFSKEPGSRYFDLGSQLASYARTMIYPLDQERFLVFMDTDTMVERIRRSESGNLIGQFRVKTGKSSWRWKAYCAILTPDSYEDIAIITVRDSVLMNDPDAEKIYTKRFDSTGTAASEEANRSALMAAEEAIASVSDQDCRRARRMVDAAVRNADLAAAEYRQDEKENKDVYKGESDRQKDRRIKGGEALKLWENMINALPVNLFWKDGNRRFVGVSRNFLKSVGMEEKNVIGRGSWELGNALTSAAFDAMEKRVLEGKNIENYPAKLLIHGGIHNVLVTESPFYKDGAISGLMGYFIDTESARADLDLNRRAQTYDTASGCMNSRGVLEALFNYSDQFSMHGIGYDMILINIPAWETEISRYGEKIAVPLLKAVGSSLKEAVGYGGFVGRLTDAVFAIMQQRKPSSLPLKELYEAIRSGVAGIRSVNGCEVSLQADITAVSAEENPKPNDMIAQTVEVLSGYYKMM